MIRHGAKLPKTPEGEDPVGLSPLGVERSQALVKVFGPGSKYNIGYIIAQHPKEDGKEDRPYLTILPTAQSFGWADNKDKFNHKIHRDDAADVVDAVNNFDGPGNIVVCWEHGQLTDIAQAFGVNNPEDPTYPKYPDDRFDLIWTLEYPYNTINSITSEHCPGLDDKYINDP